MALRSSQYDETIVALRTANGDLRMLRKHVHELHTGRPKARRTFLGQCDLKRTHDPGEYDTIRNASQALHKTLTTAWCCSQITHLDHSAKLFVDSKVDQGVSLDLLILSETPAMDTK